MLRWRASTTGARLVLWRPSRDRIEAVAEVAVDLAPGASTVVDHAFELQPDSNDPDDFGIWHVAVELINVDGNLIRDEREALDGRFAVAYPREGGAYNPQDIVLTVTTNGERFLIGQTAHYDLLVENESEQPRDVRMVLYNALGHMPVEERFFTVAASGSHAEVFERDAPLTRGAIMLRARSRSEVVLPVHRPDGTLAAVLDVDSRRPGAFGPIDVAGLGRIADSIYT